MKLDWIGSDSSAGYFRLNVRLAFERFCLGLALSITSKRTKQLEQSLKDFQVIFIHHYQRAGLGYGNLRHISRQSASKRLDQKLHSIQKECLHKVQKQFSTHG